MRSLWSSIQIQSWAGVRERQLDKPRRLVKSAMRFDKGYKEIPRLLPAAARPVARALRFVKYCGNTATLGKSMQPEPTPTTRPCARTTCQYSLQILVIIIPKTDATVPTMTSPRRWPASNIGPVSRPPRRSSKNAWIDPIQDIREGVSSLSNTVS